MASIYPTRRSTRFRGEKKADMLTIVLVSLVCLFVISIFIINFFGFQIFCDTDMYSDTMLAKLMWEQKTLFPDGWIFGNQIYVAATPVLSALLYGITGNSVLSMSIAATVMAVLVLLSFVWCVKPFAGSIDILCGVIMLLCGVLCVNIAGTFTGQLFFIMAAYYSCYVITAFIVLGDYTRSVCGIDGRFGVSFLVSILLCFAMGIQSPRETVVLIAPLVVFESLRLLVYIIRRHHFPEKSAWISTLKVALYAAANIAGHFLVRVLPFKSVNIYGSLGLRPFSEYLDVIHNQIIDFSYITGIMIGLQNNIPLLILSVISILIVYYAVIQLAFKKTAFSGLKILITVFTLSIFAVLCANLFLSVQLRTIYLFVWFLLLAVSTIFLFSQLTPSWKKRCAAGLCLFAAISYFYAYVPCLAEIADGGEAHIQSEMAVWMEENGYSIVYSGWDGAERIAVSSDDKIVAGFWDSNRDEDIFVIVEYITLQNIFSEADNTRAVYLLTSKTRDRVLDKAARLGAEMTLRETFGNGEYMLYSSADQLMHYASSD